VSPLKAVRALALATAVTFPAAPRPRRQPARKNPKGVFHAWNPDVRYPIDRPRPTP
jgi:hypothetical protein